MDDEQEGIVGFFDHNGKWAMVETIADHMADDLEIPEDKETEEYIRELLEHLADIDIINVKRYKDGRIAMSQLSQFAVDLYELPHDATLSDRIAIYQKHGQDPPQDLKERYRDNLREKIRQETKEGEDGSNGS